MAWTSLGMQMKVSDKSWVRFACQRPDHHLLASIPAVIPNDHWNTSLHRYNHIPMGCSLQGTQLSCFSSTFWNGIPTPSRSQLPTSSTKQTSPFSLFKIDYVCGVAPSSYIWNNLFYLLPYHSPCLWPPQYISFTTTIWKTTRNPQWNLVAVFMNLTFLDWFSSLPCSITIPFPKPLTPHPLVHLWQLLPRPNGRSIELFGVSQISSSSFCNHLWS